MISQQDVDRLASLMLKALGWTNQIRPQVEEGVRAILTDLSSSEPESGEAVSAWRSVFAGMKRLGMESDAIDALASYFEAISARSEACTMPNGVPQMKTPITPDVAKLREMLLAVEDFINEPPRRYDIEPMEVRDYRHELYRKWSPLCQAILASLSTPTAPVETLTFDMTKALPGGSIDNSTFEDIEFALDRADAPSRVDGKWLTLPERIAALTTPPARVAIERARELFQAILDQDGREINPSNYNHDDVCHLNNGWVECFQIAEQGIEALSALTSTTWQGIEGDAEPHIFLDCDGVLADFDSYAEAYFGMPPRAYEAKVGSAQFWKELEAKGDFYLNLPLMPDAYKLFEGVKHLHPTILTGCPRGDWAQGQKVAWAAKHFPGVPIITCRSADKRDYAKPGDVLIDDWAQHRHRWIEMGGVFITHHDAQTSLAALRAHFPKLAPPTEPER